MCSSDLRPTRAFRGIAEKKRRKREQEATATMERYRDPGCPVLCVPTLTHPLMTSPLTPTHINNPHKHTGSIQRPCQSDQSILIFMAPSCIRLVLDCLVFFSYHSITVTFVNFDSVCLYVYVCVCVYFYVCVGVCVDIALVCVWRHGSF